MTGIATHIAAMTARLCHPGKRCNKEHGHWLPCQKVILQKGFCGVANACRAARPFLFLCFVLCALQLLPLQGNVHDVKALIRFLRSLIVRARCRLLGADRGRLDKASCVVFPVFDSCAAAQCSSPGAARRAGIKAEASFGRSVAFGESCNQI